MLEAAKNTMLATKGSMFNAAMGISAPQVGCSKRFIVFDELDVQQGELSTTVALNPRLLEVSNSSFTVDEGCISMPW